MNPNYFAEVDHPSDDTGAFPPAFHDTIEPVHQHHVANPPQAAAAAPSKRSNKRESSSHLRKAPQAPRRFKSNYILFFMDKQDEIKAQLGHGASVGEVSKRSSEMWSKLSKEDRLPWDEKAKADKERYNMEKAAYTGPWQVPWRRAKKDPNAPKRPMSAFLFFSQHKRRQIKEANPGMRNTEISRTLGQMWRTASEEERAPHIEREAKEREKYKLEIAKWRKEDALKKKNEKEEQQQAEQSRQSASQQPQPQDYTPYPSESSYAYPPQQMQPQPHNPQQQEQQQPQPQPQQHRRTNPQSAPPSRPTQVSSHNYYGGNYDYYQSSGSAQGYTQPNSQYGTNYGYPPPPPPVTNSSSQGQGQYYYHSGYQPSTSEDSQTVTSSRSMDIPPPQSNPGYPLPQPEDPMSSSSVLKQSHSSGSGYPPHTDTSQHSGQYSGSYSAYPPPHQQGQRYSYPQSFPDNYDEYKTPPPPQT